MSGRKQHHIPRLMLRGFLIEGGKGTEKVWVTRADGKSYSSSISDVACERDFYSDPSIDGTKTLDDKITEYESRLAGLVNTLRSLNVGAKAPTDIVAEIIAHLVPRAANMRNLLRRGLGGVVEGAASAFKDPQRVASLLGIDGLEPGDKFRQRLGESIGDAMPIHSIPQAVFDRVAFALVREGFPQTFPGLAPMMEGLLQQLAVLGGETMRENHAKALSQSLAHPTHQQDLQRFEWFIAAGPPAGALLPDCVTLARRGVTVFTPYILTDRTDVNAIVLPISSSKLIVGVLPDAELPDLSNFNEDAAACSESFVVGSSKPVEVQRVSQLIGLRSSKVVDETILQAVESELPSRQLDASAIDASTITPVKSFPVNFSDDVAPEVVSGVAQAVSEIVVEYMTIAPLQRLDGITFANDLQSAIHKLNDNYTTTTLTEAIDEGYAEGPLVVRDGIVKAHIVMRIELARAIASDDAIAAAVAVHLLVHELAAVTFIDHLEFAFPGILAERFPDQHTASLFLGVLPAIRRYFSARASAEFAGPQYEPDMREYFLRVIQYSRETMQREVADYLQTKNMSSLFAAAVKSVTRILCCTSSWLGYKASLNLPIFGTGDALEAKLVEAGLMSWLKVFEADLQRIWERRGVWQTRSELFGMMCHVERLLWTMGIFPSKQPDGGIYVDLR